MHCQTNLPARFMKGAVAVITAAAFVACSDDGVEPPTTGTISVTVATTGTDLDPDGYTALVDEANGQAVGINGSASFTDVEQGDRTVSLAGLSANCAVVGDNPRTVTVQAGQTTSTTFNVTCNPTTGGLTVTASTTGANPDPDGYTVAVDGGTGQALAVNGSVPFTGVSVGARSVQLSGIAANCTVTGANPAMVTVSGGTTATHTFNVTCTALVGSVQVTTATTGSSIDANGYTMTVEGQTTVPMTVNDTATVVAVPIGARTVTLGGIAANCSVVNGTNPRSVTVPAGDTVSTTFNVTCVAALSDKIAFDTDRSGNLDIYTMSSTGATVQQLTTNAARDAEPYVSPSGTTIAFVSQRDGNNEIYVMNADGTGQTRLTTAAGEDREPAWSPDGTKIAFASNRHGDYEVFVMNADGSNQTRLTTQTGRDGLPNWSPDGTRIVFTSERDGDLDVWIMNADGTNPTQLTNADGGDFAAAFSPDGTKIAFTSERDGTGAAAREIYVMNADGSNQTRLTNNTAADLAPTWSPDGTRIAFASERDGNSEIYVMNANGSGQTDISNNAGYDFEPSWSP